jgi:hypothetical protein
MEIVSIILRLKHQEIKVTVDEAKELLGQLTAVFGGEKPIIQKEYIPYPVYPTHPQYPWWTRPWWDYQPILIYNTGMRGNISWQGDTCSITSDAGDLISSVSYSTSWKPGDPTSQGGWQDKNGVSILGGARAGSSNALPLDGSWNWGSTAGGGSGTAFQVKL